MWGTQQSASIAGVLCNTPVNRATNLLKNYVDITVSRSFKRARDYLTPEIKRDRASSF